MLRQRASYYGSYLVALACYSTSAYAFNLCHNNHERTQQQQSNFFFRNDNNDNKYYESRLFASAADSSSSSDNNDDDINNTEEEKSSTTIRNSAFTRNEFSRIINIDRIFSNRRRALNQSQRDHVVTVKADEKERTALAERFDLKGISKLTAELNFRPAQDGLAELGYGGSFPVEAEGMIEAQLTQTCVRTNEEFEVDVEIPVYAIIRPVESNYEKLNGGINTSTEKQIQEEEDVEESNNKGKKKNKKNKKKKDNSFHENKKVYNLDDIFDLQTALQEADSFSSGGGNSNNGSGGSDDEDGAADVVEDEGIYSLSSDQLDVGELIAQTFWLELDWYPKKPGTDPMEFEISG